MYNPKYIQNPEDILLKIVGFEKFSLIERYIHLIEEWNKKINLVSRKNKKSDIQWLIIDSLGITQHLEQNNIIYDIGTGAGLPGIPLAILTEIKSIYLVDVTQKKIDFLNYTIKDLKLPINVLRKDCRELYIKNSSNVVFIAKAVANCKKLLSICYLSIKNVPSLKIILLKGPSYKNEIIEARKYFKFKLEVFSNIHKYESIILVITDISKL
ncbi:16S rRNA (guanine(527)-N(7))-methyltransferase RsmG [Lyticum sinuosum]|uniref:Ribosomal RNA small subunit methyltransferase G n=1 Tax=Lyticum sinuosum TaxID=1332059 RepID=A0AAE5AHR2_9RICK|nr:16S rRNA (guanine(527)-N(7))-methyltransferase RsmG [Lyticum sinuosum]MDZ5761044.1 Ribosomal RNA small subunit methyltransferase G [Lyticum sinuosum]